MASMTIMANKRLIRVDLCRGCFLLLTWAEYQRGIKRGKAARRRESNEKRSYRPRGGNG
jgi:hypothetical protein